MAWCSPERRQQLDPCSEVLGFITTLHISWLLLLFIACMPSQDKEDRGIIRCRVSILIAFTEIKALQHPKLQGRDILVTLIFDLVFIGTRSKCKERKQYLHSLYYPIMDSAACNVAYNTY